MNEKTARQIEEMKKKDGGTPFTTEELTEGVSLFSSAYSGATGLGTAKGTAGNTAHGYGLLPVCLQHDKA